jgi:hypothetical protein
MRKVILLTVLTLGTATARAGNGLFYLGAGLSYNGVKNITALGNQGDINGYSWKAFAGVRPLKWLAAEADYMDLGNGHTAYPFDANTCLDITSIYGYRTCTQNAHSHGSAYAGYLVGFLPIPVPIFDMFAKAGAAHWKFNGDSFPAVYTASSFSTSGTDFAWGIGVQAHISMFGARLEYEQFNIANTSGAKIASLSVFLNF